MVHQPGYLDKRKFDGDAWSCSSWVVHPARVIRVDSPIKPTIIAAERCTEYRRDSQVSTQGKQSVNSSPIPDDDGQILRPIFVTKFFAFRSP